MQQIERLNQKFFASLGARLVRFPLGRKGYTGRVERISTAWVLGPGNHLLTHYIDCTRQLHMKSCKFASC